MKMQCKIKARSESDKRDEVVLLLSIERVLNETVHQIGEELHNHGVQGLSIHQADQDSRDEFGFVYLSEGLLLLLFLLQNVYGFYLAGVGDEGALEGLLATHHYLPEGLQNQVGTLGLHLEGLDLLGVFQIYHFVQNTQHLEYVGLVLG